MALKIAPVALIILFSPAPRVFAATYYVATTGSDSNPGTFAAPWKTFKKATDVVAAGDTVLFRGGTYAGFKTTRRLPGTAGAPIIFKPFNNERVIIDKYANRIVVGHVIEISTGASFFTLDGFEITDSNPALAQEPTYCDADSKLFPPGSPVGNGIKFYPPCDHLTLQNLDVHHVAQMGIQGNCADLKVLNNRIHDLGKGGYQPAYGTYIEGRRMIVRGNTIYRTIGNGIRLGNTTDGSDNSNALVENNVIYNVEGTIWWYDPSASASGACILREGGSGIVGWGTPNSLFRNNIVVNNRSSGLRVNSVTTLSNGPGSRIYNNTIYGNHSVGLMVYSYDTVRNNIVFGNNTGDSTYRGIYFVYSGNVKDHNLESDPRFVNAAAMDFRLQPGSPAINTGAALSEVSNDFAGVTRPQGGAWDIGAFEFVSGTPVANAAPGKVRGLRWR